MKLLVVGCLLALGAFAAPAQAATFDLTISTAPSNNVTASGGSVNVITPTGPGAVLNVSQLESYFGMPTVIEVGSTSTTSTITIANDISTSTLGELDFNAATGIAINTAAISTLELQSYNAPVTLGADTTLSTDQIIVFGSTVDGAQSLTINGPGEFVGAVGSSTALTSLSVSGATTETGSITTTGGQAYTGPFDLQGNSTLTSTGSGAVAFDSTVDGSNTLEVNTAGTTTFGGTVGGTAPPMTLINDGPVTINTGSIQTIDFQMYNGPVTLGADTTLTTTAPEGIYFRSTVDGRHALTVDTGGQATFGDAVGATTELKSVTTESPGNSRQAVTSTYLSVSVTTSGAQTYSEPVFLMASTIMTSTGSGNITFGSTVEPTGPAAESLTVNTGGTTSFDGDVGYGNPPAQIASLTTDAPGRTVINAAEVLTAGNQTFNDPVTIGANLTDATQSGNLTFGSTVDGPFSLDAEPNGTVTLGGAVGGTTPLTSMTAGSSLASSVMLDGSVTTTGAQTYKSIVTIGADVTAKSTGSGAITFSNTVGGAHALTVDTAGTTTFNGTEPAPDLGSLTVSRGKTVLDATGMATTGSQTYDGPVTGAIEVDFRSTGGANIKFGSTLNVDFLNVITTGTTTFDGPVGSGNLSVSGPSVLDGGRVTTNGDQTWAAITLGADASLTASGSGTITAGGPVSLGAHTLTIDGAGTFSGTLSGSGGLLKHGGKTLVLSGTNSYSGGTTITGGLVNFTSQSSLGTGKVTVDGGGLRWATGNTADISPQLNAIGIGGATFDTNGNDVTLATALSGSGPLAKSGAGTLTLSGNNTVSGAVDATGGTLHVTGTVPGPVTIESSGTLNCDGGTLPGGVTNDGGTALGAPGAPTSVSGSPGDGQVTVSFTPGQANCYPLGPYTAIATPSGAHASGNGSPITVAGLSDATGYTFTVSATNPIGSTSSAPSASVTPESAPPSVRITSPASGATYSFGENVATSFTCAEAAGGPGIASCTDSNGATGTSGTLRTSHAGKFTYTVTATSKDGQTAKASITYTVRPNNHFRVTHVRTFRNGTFRFDVSVPGPGSIDVLITNWKSNFAHTAAFLLPAPRRSVFARKHAIARRTRTVRLTVKPNARGRYLLKHHTYKVVFRLWVTYTPTGGVPRSVKAYSLHLGGA